MDDASFETPRESERDSIWRRKCEIFYDIERLWLKYLEKLDYPRIDFVTFVIMNHKKAQDRTGAKYLIWIWQVVKRFSNVHVN
jgi:hypothetical protein